MAVDVNNFIIKPNEFGGLYQAADTLERRKIRETEFAQQQEGKKLATTKFLTDYLDPKDRLTGSNYDPEIVNQLQTALQEGAALAAKGASSADIMMALGPKVNKINEYSTKAKLVNQNIKSQLEKIKAYGGYNLAALEDEAKKMAFQNDDGSLKDISLVDPSMNWITEATHKRPELVTTGAGFDQFVQKTPMSKTSRTVQTSHAGNTRNVAYEADAPFWEDISRDDKGNIMTDVAGNPVGLDVLSAPIIGDDGKPLVDKNSGKAYRAADENVFNAIMKHNPDVADYVRGQVNRYFKEAGAEKIPEEGSPQWNMKARNIVYDELKTRSKSSFKTKDQEKQSSVAAKIEIAQDPALLQATRDYYSATRKSPGNNSDKVNKTTTYADVLSGIMNNDPNFSSGEITNVKGRDVVDVTSLIPDLKYSNDQVYKKVYRDPNNNSLIVEKQNGEQQEVPEGKVFQFMNKLSGYNNLNPEYVRKVMEESGFDGSKFSKSQPNNYQQQIGESRQKQQQERASKVQSFESSGKVDEVKPFEGTKTNDGTIKKISKTSAFNLVNDYYIEFEDGTEKTFKNKKDLADYLKRNQPSQPKASSTSQTSKGILD